MGINLKDYKVHVVDSPVDQASLCTKNDDVAFYRAHFEVGLRLPLDPFFYKFLDLKSSAPIDINLHMVRLLVCFAIVYRSLGFEPRISIFMYFFTVQSSSKKGGDLLGARSRPNKPQMFTEPPNKV